MSFEQIEFRVESHHYEKFDVPAKRWTTVLDALLYVKNHLDHSIAIRFSCRMASCGSRGIMINGIPRLVCYTKISDLGGSSITCEPLTNFPLIRDLATDFSDTFLSITAACNHKFRMKKWTLRMAGLHRNSCRLLKTWTSICSSHIG